MSRWGGLRALATVLAAPLLGLPAGTVAHAAAGQSSAPPSFYRTSLSQGLVTLYWTDNSDNETGFSLQTGTVGNWRQIGEVLSRDSGGAGMQYTWTDPTPLRAADGDRCYRVVLSYPTGGQTPGISETRCLSAPVPPADPSTPVVQPSNATQAPPATVTTPTGRTSVGATAAGPAPANPGAASSGPPGMGLAADPTRPGPGNAPAPAAAGGDAPANGWLLGGASVLVSSGFLVGGAVWWSRRRRTPARAAALSAPAPAPVPVPVVPPAPRPASPVPAAPPVPRPTPSAGFPPPVDPWADAPV